MAKPHLHVIQLLSDSNSHIEPLTAPGVRFSTVIVASPTQAVGWAGDVDSHLRILHDPGGFNRVQRLNMGLRHVLQRGGRYVLCMQPDVRLQPDAVTALLEAIEENGSIGLVGPRVDLRAGRQRASYHGGGWIDLDGGRYHTPDPDARDYCVDYVMPDAMLLRTSVLRHVGLFDVRLVMRWSVVDWCLRMQYAGWRPYVAGGCRAVRWKVDDVDARDDAFGFAGVVHRHSRNPRQAVRRGSWPVMWQYVNRFELLGAWRFFTAARNHPVSSGTIAYNRAIQPPQRNAA